MPRIEKNGKTYTENDFNGPNSVTSSDDQGNTTTIKAGANSIVTNGDLHADSIDMGEK